MRDELNEKEVGIEVNFFFYFFSFVVFGAIGVLEDM